MATPRIVCWCTGAALGLGLAAWVSEDLFPGARPFVFGLVLLIGGLCGEWLDIRRQRSMLERAAAQCDSRPADQHIDIAPCPEFRGEPNLFDPRFRRFEAVNDPLSIPTASTEARDTTCPPLLGRIVIASLFLGRNGRSWSETELAEGHAAILRAAIWLEREASRHGAAVNLEVAEVYFVADDDEPDDVALGFVTQGEDVGPFEEHATIKALHRVSRAARLLGFPDAPTLARVVEHQAQADALVWLLHPREASRSFAIPLDEHAPGGIGLAVCYPREASFPESLIGPARVDPVTVVHELLHLFGASDKYGRALSTFATGTVTGREVMRLSEDRLSRLQIDPATAVEIGWSAL